MSAKNLICAIGALTLCAGAANASFFEWNWAPGDPGQYGINNNGGQFSGVNATFNANTNQLTWTVAFTNDVTEGFTLALNNGPNPKGHGGELALLYVDASDANDVMITAYSYNGQNNNRSWRDGNGQQSGDQPADLIMNANQRNDWVLSASVTDVNGARTISFTADVTDILGHTPMYPDPDLPPSADPREGWYGIGFAEQLGLWMHPYRTFDATYDPQTGAISALSTSGEGWFDGRNFETVPTPGAVALAGLSGLAMLRRRRA
ncbi:MAG: hypothetical protein Tsb0013_23820 [Phycisphaerales bacterium]